MRSVTRYLLWFFVFTVPWDIVMFPGFGALSRIAGLATLGAALVTTIAEGRFRKPGAIFGFASAFVAFSMLSVFWTISYSDTIIGGLFTSIQVLGSVWVIQEFSGTREQQQSLLVAFCLGELIPLAGVFNAFGAGRERALGRYTAFGINLDDIGCTLVIGIPMAWHLMNRYTGVLRSFVRAVALVYLAVGPVGVLLTGTRTAILAGVVALSIVPLTLPIRSTRAFLVSTALLVTAGGAAAVVVPDSTWARIFTIREEVLEGGRMTGRREIWEAGLAVFPSHPLLGAGTGAYGAAVEPVLNTNRVAPHNLFIGMLVEHGIVGFLIYAALLGACAVSIMRMPPFERKLFSVLMLSWLISALSNNWESKKVTWVLFGLVAAQSAAGRVGSRLSPSQRLTGAASRRSVPAVHSPSVRQRAVR